MNKIEVGDVVRITDSTHNWFPAFVTVTEVKSWGIQGYVVIPANGPEWNGQAYTRLKTGVYEYVGKAVVIAMGE